jgi:RND family efflux transporter MFP subunit
MRTIAAIGTLPGILFLAACAKHGNEQVGSPDLPPLEVQIVEVEQREYLRTQGLPGTVHPVDQAVIASKLMATIEEVDVVIGQQVTEGDVLIRLIANEISAQVEQAEAALAQLQRNLVREQALLAQSATTAETVRTLEDQIRVARARLEEARIMETYKTIRAPFSGHITAKEVRRGDLATPGMPLLTIEGLGNLEVHVNVPDSLQTLALGAEVSLESGNIGETGQLVEWSTAANPASRTRLAKLKVSEPTALRSGQYVKVLWPAIAEPILWLNAAAIREVGQLDQVFTVEEGRLQLQLIRTGPRLGGGYQILAGLRPGDKVVLNPDPRTRDGQPAILKP